MWRTSSLLTLCSVAALSCTSIVDKQLPAISSVTVSVGGEDRVVDVAIADLNQDGRDDLLVGVLGTAGSSLVPYFQDEKHILQQGDIRPVEGEILRILAQDISADVGLEMIVLKKRDNLAESHRIEIFSQNLNQQSQEIAIATILPPDLIAEYSLQTPRTLAAGFLLGNEDDADIVVGDRQTGLAAILVDATSSAASPTDFIPLQTADQGIVALHIVGENIVLLQPNGSVSLAANQGGVTRFESVQVVTTGLTPFGSTHTDLDQNNIDDLAVVGLRDNAPVLQVFPNIVDTLPSTELSFSVSQAGLLATGDFDANGSADLSLVAPRENGTESSLSLLFSAGGALTETSFKEEQLLFSCEAPESIAAGDLNGDGLADVVVGEKNGNRVSVYLGR